jgi:hypothetical protein
MLIRNEFTNEQINSGVLTLIWLSTEFMITDIGTKGKWGKEFMNFLTMLNMR